MGRSGRRSADALRAAPKIPDTSVVRLGLRAMSSRAPGVRGRTGSGCGGPGPAGVHVAVHRARPGPDQQGAYRTRLMSILLLSTLCIVSCASS